MNWTGQCTVNRTSNGFVVYPKLAGDGQALPGDIAVVEGHESFGRLANAIKTVYLNMDARAAAQKEANANAIKALQADKMKPVPIPDPEPEMLEKPDEPIQRVPEDQEPERKLV